MAMRPAQSERTGDERQQVHRQSGQCHVSNEERSEFDSAPRENEQDTCERDPCESDHTYPPADEARVRGFTSAKLVESPNPARGCQSSGRQKHHFRRERSSPYRSKVLCQQAYERPVRHAVKDEEMIAE